MKSIFFLATLLFVTPAIADDVYIGTLSSENGKLILLRCDIAQNKYILQDKKNSKDKPVANYLKGSKRKSGLVYAEIWGDYDEKKGENYLLVKSIDNVTDGKSCHLLDM